MLEQQLADLKRMLELQQSLSQMTSAVAAGGGGGGGVVGAAGADEDW